MNGQALLQMQAMPEYIAASATVALAIWLLRLDSRNATSLAFSGFLLSRAGSMFTFTFQNLIEADPASPVSDVLFWERLRPVFVIATVYALLLFLILYARPGPSPRRGPLLVCSLLLMASEAAYVLRPDLWATYRVATAADGTETLQFQTLGPLFLFQLLRVVSFGAAAFLLALVHTRTAPGPRRDSLLLFFTAFALHAVFDATDALALMLGAPSGALAGWLALQLSLEAANLAPVGAAALLLLRSRRHATGSEPRSIRRALLVLPFPAATSLLVWLLVHLRVEAPNGPWSLFFLGLWRLSLPLLATYALVRHQLFGIDVRVKRTLQRAIVAIVFILVFFGVSEGAEALLVGQGLAPALGILATALLTFAIFPLERLAQRLADTAMPDVQSVSDLDRHERRALYRALARSALESGVVSPDEQRLLDVARRHLGIGEADGHLILEEERGRLVGGPRKA